MAAAAFLTHHTPASQALMNNNRIAAMDSSSGTSGSSGSSSSNSATISANDFLTLLVTEMQNQDPTADTDPNEYVNQLVQVNSLEQLININQTLTGAFDPSSSTSGTGSASTANVSPAALAQTPAVPALPPAHAHVTPGSVSAAGNLSVPATSAAAQRVGRALDGHTPAQPAAIRFPRTF